MSEPTLLPALTGAAGFGHGTYEPAGRKTDAGRGIEWLKQGWELFKKNPGIWIAITAITGVLFIVSAFIPLIGGLAINLLSPVLVGGVMLGCHALARGEPFGIETLFAGFKQNTANLVLVGVFYMVGTLVIGVVTFLIVLVTAGSAGLAGAGGASGGALALLAGGTLIAVLVGLALLVPLMMAFYFAPLLVVFRNVAPLDAMKASFSACLKNIVPFLVYGLVIFVPLLVAMIPLGLGLLVMGPVLLGSTYAAYMDVFE